MKVCGDIAGNLSATRLLFGLGITGLSMASSLILEVKEVVRGIDCGGAEELDRKAPKCGTVSEVYALLDNM
jgi:phosphoenolpyruvate-protein kinase (PTS system EI component)